MSVAITRELFDAGQRCFDFVRSGRVTAFIGFMPTREEGYKLADRLSALEQNVRLSGIASGTAAHRREAAAIIETALAGVEKAGESNMRQPTAVEMFGAASAVHAYRRAEARAPQAVPTPDVYALLDRAAEALRAPGVTSLAGAPSAAAKLVAEIDKALSRADVAPVYLATYQIGTHTEPRVFSSPAAAERWREEIADNGWTGVFMDKQRPRERDVMADLYFEKASGSLWRQTFNVEPTWPDREPGWTPPGGAARIEPQKIWIGLWTHREGVDARAFSSPEQAEAWRQEIADDNWDDEMNVERPETPAEMADIYFDTLMERNGGEFFDVETSLLDAQPHLEITRDLVTDASPAP